MKKYISIILFIICLGMTFLPLAALAQNEVRDGLIIIKLPLGMTDVDLRVVLSRLVNQAMGLIGIVFVCIVIFSGFLYMMSMGDADKAKKAKNTISQGIIGLVIIFTSYSIANFLINSIRDASMQ